MDIQHSRANSEEISLPPFEALKLSRYPTEAIKYFQGMVDVIPESEDIKALVEDQVLEVIESRKLAELESVLELLHDKPDALNEVLARIREYYPIGNDTFGRLTVNAADLSTPLGFGMRGTLDVLNDGAAALLAKKAIAWAVESEVMPSARARIGTAITLSVQKFSLLGFESLDYTMTLNDREMIIQLQAGWRAGGENVRPDLYEVEWFTKMASLLAEDITIDTHSEGHSEVLSFSVPLVDFENENDIDLTELDCFHGDTLKELIAAVTEDPDAPVRLSPSGRVILGRVLLDTDMRRELD